MPLYRFMCPKHGQFETIGKPGAESAQCRGNPEALAADEAARTAWKVYNSGEGDTAAYRAANLEAARAASRHAETVPGCTEHATRVFSPRFGFYLNGDGMTQKTGWNKPGSCFLSGSTAREHTGNLRLDGSFQDGF